MFRTLLLMLCIALASCGQTGPLYPQPVPEALANTDRANNVKQLP